MNEMRYVPIGEEEKASSNLRGFLKQLKRFAFSLLNRFCAYLSKKVKNADEDIISF